MAVRSGISRAIRLGWLAVAAVWAGSLHASFLHAQTQPSKPVLPGAGRSAPTAVVPRAVLDKYCVACHNERLNTAGLRLDKMDPDHVGDVAEIWEKVARKLRTREMPPPGRPRP